MQRVFTTWFSGISTVFLCCVSLSLPVFAAPPVGKTELLSPAASARPLRLDLRPPSLGDAWATKAGGGSPHSVLVRDDGYSSDDRHSFPTFINEARQPAIVGRAAALAERFRHEGLPLARLWENRAAFVSLGLNGRGKPGLWLVQKTH